MISSSPILLCGLPRSGTSWIGKIVDSHPHTLYLHEPDKILPLRIETRNDGRLEEFIAAYVDQLPTKLSTDMFVYPLMRKEGSTRASHALKTAAISGAKLLSRCFGNMRLPSVLRGHDDLRLAWKSVRLPRYIATVARAAPHQRVVYIIRHVGGYLGSQVVGRKIGLLGGRPENHPSKLLEQLFDDNNEGQSIEYGLRRTDIAEMEPYQRMAWYWTIINHRAIVGLRAVGNALIVSYDRFAVDPINVAQKMFGHLELNWCAEVERYIGLSTCDDRANYYSLTKDPIKSSTKWRSVLSVEQVEWICSHILPTVPGRFCLEEPIK
jgi:hypothetical protein